jgi:GT2 family glycosyltransferase
MSLPAHRPSIVVLGMITKMPVAGVIWQTLHYLIGFQRLGYDVYYVECHGRTPSMLMELEADDGSARAASLLASIMRRFGLGDRWAYIAAHDDHRCFGISPTELRRVYASASMLLDLHGGTFPTDELAATDRLVYLETDPVQLQLELAGGYQPTHDFLDPHCAFFTFAENYGGADSELPVSDRYPFKKTRQPVVLDFWENPAPPAGTTFTTVGNWRQNWRDVEVNGETYTWSKDQEFTKFLDAPRRLGERFELALASYADEDRRMLEERGWRVAHALAFSMDLHGYRRYVSSSYGEFTAAKEQNVRLRTGWFSDRSATYLAAGRPVITQDTGFDAALPTGAGLFPFLNLDDVQEAVERIDREPKRHQQAALQIAREFFSHDIVLGDLLGYLGMATPPRYDRSVIDDVPRRAFPFDMSITPVSRRPTQLSDATVDIVLRSALPRPPLAPATEDEEPKASIVVVSYNSLVFTRLCLETVLANTDLHTFELIVVDNGSTDGSPEYLRDLAARDPRVRPIANDDNRGFPAACNQGLEVARGDCLVLLNSDAMVAPGWLRRLLAPVEADPSTLTGPVTNRIGNEAEVATEYDTWGDFLREARRLGDSRRGKAFEIPTLTMFCLAMSRSAYDQLGPLDTQYGVGTLEDDDYSMRARKAGCTLLCLEDVLVHHFGEGSFGKLFGDGEYSRVIGSNRRKFERKWGSAWEPYARRPEPEYAELVESFRHSLADAVPAGAKVLVVSKGDESLLDLHGLEAWHFPRGPQGEWGGYNPSDSAEALVWIEELRARGAAYIAIPRTSFWWLDFYEDLARHLGAGDGELLRNESLVVFRLGEPADAERSDAVASTDRGG